MYKKKKEVQRSIRMTKEVDEYIQGFNGTGFNEKLENIVLFCISNEKKIDERIKRKKEELRQLDLKTDEVYSMIQTLNTCVNQSENLKESIERCNSKITAVLTDQ